MLFKDIYMENYRNVFKFARFFFEMKPESLSRAQFDRIPSPSGIDVALLRLSGEYTPDALSRLDSIPGYKDSLMLIGATVVRSLEGLGPGERPNPGLCEFLFHSGYSTGEIARLGLDHSDLKTGYEFYRSVNFSD